MFGTLWVIATPLGNIEDISTRAIKTLECVDILLAEDTRKTGMLLSLLGITVPHLWSFHNYTEQGKTASIIAQLQQGKNIGIVSDAGMPTISDPGYLLVSACHKEGIQVSVIPGASSVITSLAGSGIAPIPFTFIGFLPKTIGDRRKAFEPFISFESSIICFDRKNRVSESLRIAYEVLGERDICIAREITKLHEEYICTTLRGFPSLSKELRGEITLVIGKAKETYKTPLEDVKLLCREYSQEDTIREYSKQVVQKTHGYTVKEIYSILESMKKEL